MSLPDPKHDNFVRRLLADPVRAASALWAHLPAEIVGRMDDGRPPELLEGTLLVDDGGRKLQCDALFRLRPGEDDRDAVLVQVEHKSRADRALPLKLMQYRSVIWMRELEAGGMPLPTIHSLVLYYGTGAWTVPGTVAGMVGTPAFVKGMASGSSLTDGYDLLNLRDVEPRKLADHPQARAALLVLALSGSGEDAEGHVDLIVEGVANDDRHINGASGPDAGHRASVLEEAVRRARPECEEYCMATVAEQYALEGFTRGRDEGRKEGTAATLHRLLQLKFKNVPPTRVRQVNSASGAELDAWTASILTARNIDEVFAGGNG